MPKIELKTYEDLPEWNSMEIKNPWSTWVIDSYPEGAVEIRCYDNVTSPKVVILNQDELKQVIAFLQTKVK